MFTAVIYGLSSGFGLPFMMAKVFPLIFTSDQQGVVVAVRSSENSSRYVEIGRQSMFHMSDNLLLQSADGEWQPVPEGTTVNVNGYCKMPSGKEFNLSALRVKDGDELVPVEPKLYTKNEQSKFIPLISDQDSKPSFWFLFWTAMMLPGVFLVRGVAGFINTYQITYCGSYILEHIRMKVFSKLQDMDLDFFQKHKSGDLMTRIMTEAARLQQMLTSTSNDLIKQPIIFLGALGSLIYLSFQQKEFVFILACLAIIPIAIFPIRKLSKLMLVKMRMGAKGEGHLGACLQENLMAVRDVRHFNLKEHQNGKFGTMLHEFFKTIMKVTKYRAIITPSVEIITAFGITFAIFYSSQKGLSLEQVLPLMFALYMCYEPIKRMGQLQSQLVLGTVAIERLEQILKAEPNLKPTEDPIPLPTIEGGITFEDVSFRYEADSLALNDVNLRINPGEVIALVGPSGAGKSTFTHLVTRTHEYHAGRILFDGEDIRKYSIEDVRSQVSVVSQDPYLFDDTVMNNILMGNLNASEEEVYKAAEQAQCVEFIDKLPKGYNTIVGEKATRLSGGQRQRLAIARAFLKDSAIIVLDEATSALDAESEQKVQSALAELVKGKTVLIIAHRFSSIKIANRILVFNEGKVVDDGDHDTLYENNVLYKDLYNKQLL